MKHLAVFCVLRLLWKTRKTKSHLQKKSKKQKQIGQLRCQQTATIIRKAKIVQDIGHSGETGGTEKFRIQRVKRDCEIKYSQILQKYWNLTWEINN